MEKIIDGEEYIRVKDIPDYVRNNRQAYLEAADRLFATTLSIS